jgi:hypothetical protein
MKTSKPNRRRRLQIGVIAVVVIICAAIGYHFLGPSHAATSYISSEGESGTVASPAVVGSDTVASNGKYVKFGTTAVADPVIMAAGDISCPSSYLKDSVDCHQTETSALLAGATSILTLGDNQYENNQLPSYLTTFNLSWGKYKSKIHPGIGNHEYQDPAGAAQGYFDYFNGQGVATGPAGARGKGYYSFNVGTWHMIELNANCAIPNTVGDIGTAGCAKGSPQEKWLVADLAANTAKCTLAFWHEPRFSSGGHGNFATVAPFWDDLYAAHADVVLGGHDHNYERFAPQTPAGVASPTGISEFIVGTGGRDFDTLGTRRANSQAFQANVFGVLKMTLHPTGYDWQFLPEAGGSFTDSGSASCT